MSSVSQVQALPGPESNLKAQIFEWLPFAAPILGALVMVYLRVQLGPSTLLYDGSLIVLAVICYMIAGVIGLTELYASQAVLGRWGLWLTSLGLFFNASSWGTRWIALGDQDHWQRWVFRYVPFVNLYDLSIAFAMGAALAAVVICRKHEQRAMLGLSMVFASLIIMLAIFIGRDFITLQPVLDSYWRPIHVGIASISYGVTLICFSLAVLYLIKDRVPIEGLALFVALFGLGVYAAINRFSLFWDFQYTLSALAQNPDGTKTPIPFRVDLPYAGPLMILAALLLAAALVCYALDFYRHERRLSPKGHLAFKASAVVQAVSLGVVFYQMRTVSDFASRINVASQLHFPKVQEWLQVTSPAQVDSGRVSGWIRENNGIFSVSPNSNPVEMGALITLLVLTGLVVLFNFRPERMVERLPSLQRLDGLIYKTAAVAFVGLAMLLITGAIWANESWGRYWGWDSKETGAFVAWVAYAGYLHTRVAHGWSGRRSAYFAIAGFLLVIFTYLGVSYLLPGLHSYA